MINLGPPYHINEEGTKWWVNSTLTDHARYYKLNLTAFITETTDGVRMFLLIKQDELLWEGQSFEAAAAFISMLGTQLEMQDE